MRLIDQQFLLTPFYGNRRMTACLKRSGGDVGPSKNSEPVLIIWTEPACSRQVQRVNRERTRASLGTLQKTRSQIEPGMWRG